jgi:hypothetical protein
VRPSSTLQYEMASASDAKRHLETAHHRIVAYLTEHPHPQSRDRTHANLVRCSGHVFGLRRDGVARAPLDDRRRVLDPQRNG